MTTTTKWAFQTRFRRRAFERRASQTAVERITQALAEIGAAAIADPLHGAEGAVAFLRRVSPALEDVDSSCR